MTSSRLLSEVQFTGWLSLKTIPDSQISFYFKNRQILAITECFTLIFVELTIYHLFTTQEKHLLVFVHESLTLVFRTEGGLSSQPDIPLLQESEDVVESHPVSALLCSLKKLPGRDGVCPTVGHH